MLKRQRLLTLVVALMLLAILGPAAVAPAADKDATKPVAGILIEKKDDTLTVKADGEDEPVKYQIPSDNKALVKTLKGIFNAARVQLTYKKDGDSWQLLTIKKQVLAATGTVTGTVFKVYDNFWVEVKPKNGVADAYAPGANYKNKEFMDLLKSLKNGDSVTITYTTDFERHRILTLKKN
jgi:preprotein translocase subunit YajC